MAGWQACCFRLGQQIIDNENEIVDEKENDKNQTVENENGEKTQWLDGKHVVFGQVSKLFMMRMRMLMMRMRMIKMRLVKMRWMASTLSSAR